MSLNKVMLIGRLGRDVDLKYTQSGKSIAFITVATDESYIDQDGNKAQKTEWHKVVVHGRQAENCANYLVKGSLVFVEGKLQTRKWQDREGQTKYTTEIIASMVQFLDRKEQNNGCGGGDEERLHRYDRKPEQKYEPHEDDYTSF